MNNDNNNQIISAHDQFFRTSMADICTNILQSNALNLTTFKGMKMNNKIQAMV